MKATSVLKLLTAVTFLLTARLAWGAADISTEAAGRTTTLEECESICGAVATKSGESDPVKRSALRQECAVEARCASKDKTETGKEVKAACTEAVKEWKEAAQKSKNACDEYDAAKSSDNSCEGRIKACEKKIGEVSNLVTSQGAAGAGQLDASGGTVSVLTQFYAQKNGIDPKTLGAGAASAAATSCLKWSNDKADDKKKELENKLERIDDKIKAAKQKMADLEKEIAKENESLRKETATLDEEKEKIQTTFKENVAKLDVKKREKYTALNKAIQDNLVKIRNLTNVITALKEKLEKEKFDQNQRMVDFAEDKIDAQCKGAVDTARGCFMRAAKGEKFPAKDTCEGFSPTGKGVTGTSVLVKKLNDVRTACFERAQLAQDRLRYDYQSKIKQYEQDMMEKQNQIKDMNKSIELEKQEFDAITKENETEKTNETQASDQKQANLAEKLAKLKASTDEKIAASNKQLAQLKLEIEELVARKMPSALGIIPDSNGNDIKVAHREAKGAIEATEIARGEAYGKCDCVAKLKANEKDPTCTKLKRSIADVDGGGVGGKAKRSGR